MRHFCSFLFACLFQGHGMKIFDFMWNFFDKASRVDHLKMIFEEKKFGGTFEFLSFWACMSSKIQLQNLFDRTIFWYKFAYDRTKMLHSTVLLEKFHRKTKTFAPRPCLVWSFLNCSKSFDQWWSEWVRFWLGAFKIW